MKIHILILKTWFYHYSVFLALLYFFPFSLIFTDLFCLLNKKAVIYGVYFSGLVFFICVYLSSSVFFLYFRCEISCFSLFVVFKQSLCLFFCLCFFILRVVFRFSLLLTPFRYQVYFFRSGTSTRGCISDHSVLEFCSLLMVFYFILAYICGLFSDSGSLSFYSWKKEVMAY